MKVFAPGLAVTVLDGDPVAPAASSASGRVTVYAPGLSVAVLDCEPATTPKPAGKRRALDQSRFVCFNDWNSGERYERWQELEILRGAVSLKFHCMAAGGTNLAFLGGTYTLCGGKEGTEPICTVTPANGSTSAYFVFDASLLEEGWHLLDIQGPETCAFYPYFVMHGDTAPPQEWMPVCTGTYTINNGSQHMLEWVPSVHNPTALPLPKREYPHFSNAKHRAQLWREEIVPVRGAEIYRPNISKEGIVNTFNKQWYTWWDFLAKKPIFPLLDGPRGVGTLGGITHCEIGTFKNPYTGVTLGNLYIMDSWRVAKVRPTGEIVTLCGYRSRSIPSHWEDQPDLELVGDWSAIPEERRGFRELWGMCWDRSSLVTDESATPIPQEGNLKPHASGGPVMFVTDSQNNRVCKLTFVGGSSTRGTEARHGVDPVVTEFLTGLNDPWDIVEWNGTYLVSERKSHRICQYDGAGNLLRVVVSGQALASIDANRFVVRHAPVATIRLEPVVLPEGLYVIDDWLYFASEAMQQVKRIDLVTGEIQTVVPNYVSGKNQYLKIAVSDGTFGPKGTVFISSWTNIQYGAPKTFLPDGTSWEITTGGSAGLPRGLGGAGEPLDYSAAVACREGRLVYGSSNEGLVMLSAGLPTDPACNVSLFVAGRTEFGAAGFKLTHGAKGFGHYGLPLPWGHSAAVDYYLTWVGHVR